ncbi:hypothetical protein NPIL_600481 [Nephila pilipes]|uniref:Uncharacterized protein n=1 Tax=Nephila pilipes TaxID=299642 RepID=A0A8X6TTY5_NEPPI|nr:hypothetical protein NPIL_600481 [Nephila pilipes]
MGHIRRGNELLASVGLDRTEIDRHLSSITPSQQRIRCQLNGYAEKKNKKNYSRSVTPWRVVQFVHNQRQSQDFKKRIKK